MTDGLEPMPLKKSSKRSWLAAIVSIVVVGAIVGGWDICCKLECSRFSVSVPSRGLRWPVRAQHGFAFFLQGTLEKMLHEKWLMPDSSRVSHAISSRHAECRLDIFPGSYEFPTKLSGSAALQLLMSGSNRILVSTPHQSPRVSASHKSFRDCPRIWVLPTSQLEDAIAEQLTRLPKNAPSIEGFLFPATYSFDPNPEAGEVITAMVDRMEQELLKYEIPLVDSLPTLTLASMIASEGRFEEDLFKISRVFLNRLDIGMALQSDQTVKYRYEGNLESFQEGLKDTESLFNTFSHPGLPLGPTTNPGGLAIEAALRPADGAWLYFVAINLDTGETVFLRDLT